MDIPHGSSVLTLNMTVQIRPPHAGNVTLLIRTIVSQQNNSIFINLVFFIFDAQIRVSPG